MSKKPIIGSEKARKNFNKSALSATIIIIEGPTFSVLLKTLKILRQC
jgi:hypothetical protein